MNHKKFIKYLLGEVPISRDPYASQAGSPTIPYRLRKEVLELKERKNSLKKKLCTYCGCKVSSKEPDGSIWLKTLDHVIPKSKGGSDGLYNLVVACFKCNQSKKDLLLEEWEKQIQEEYGVTNDQCI